MPDKGSYISGELLRQAQERTAASKPATAPGELTPRSQPVTEDVPETDVASAGDTAVTDPKPTGKKRRRRGRTTLMALGLVLVLGLLVWGSIEQLAAHKDVQDLASSSTAAPSRSAGPTADSASVRAAVEYETKTNAGPVRDGCALAVNPPACEQSLIGGPIGTFSVPPKAVDSTSLDATGTAAAGNADVNPTEGKGKRTVVLITFTLQGGSQQTWAVLVRDSDHKVIGDKSIGAQESGMSLAQVGQKIQEANS